mmetsp:Transcript_62551/g.123099  ORF Transcript_62551/g.123099 Transcript_62551/m.123099 type:complete len:242 (+) Transcript_62551:66-791(+)
MKRLFINAEEANLPLYFSLLGVELAHHSISITLLQLQHSQPCGSSRSFLRGVVAVHGAHIGSAVPRTGHDEQHIAPHSRLLLASQRLEECDFTQLTHSQILIRPAFLQVISCFHISDELSSESINIVNSPLLRSNILYLHRVRECFQMMRYSYYTCIYALTQEWEHGHSHVCCAIVVSGESWANLLRVRGGVSTLESNPCVVNKHITTPKITLEVGHERFDTVRIRYIKTSELNIPMFCSR